MWTFPVSKKESLCKRYSDQTPGPVKLSTSFHAQPWPSLEQRGMCLNNERSMWANLHPRSPAFRSCLKLNVLQTEFSSTKLDPLFLLPLSSVYPLSKVQLHLSLWFPLALSSSFTSSGPYWPQGLSHSRQKQPLFSLFLLNTSIYGTHLTLFKYLCHTVLILYSL